MAIHLQVHKYISVLKEKLVEFFTRTNLPRTPALDLINQSKKISAMLEALRSEHPIELKYARISEPEEPMASAYAQPRKVHRSRHFPYLDEKRKLILAICWLSVLSKLLLKFCAACCSIFFFPAILVKPLDGVFISWSWIYVNSFCVFRNI
ncbi:uncharacterized protein [Spinacia oleracea]|uniref:Uncharacterized protein isoform X4 n=1 Tax=Spinacia oleracea TaxID=3562 RepID=A0ABM3RDV5_SPIOL|nr:uncharacterized protein LOC110782016 isoform X4 [Spinacia oleracea]XP_056693788.1 uncharacterized protein LOC110782016 isoform X4 [Spinacia oleracea]